jgi:hypothetical protein
LAQLPVVWRWLVPAQAGHLYRQHRMLLTIRRLRNLPPVKPVLLVSLSPLPRVLLK